SYSHADVYAALQAVSAILAALLARERTGLGQHVEVAMAESMLSVNEHVATDLLVGEAEAILDGSAGRGNDPLMQTADGEWVQLVGNPASNIGFPAYCHVMGRDDLLTDSRFDTAEGRRANVDEFVALLQAFVLSLDDTNAVVEAFGRHRVAVGVVRSLEDIANSDWARARDAMVPVPDRNGGTMLIPR